MDYSKVVKALRGPFRLKAPIFQDNIETTTAWNEVISNPEPIHLISIFAIQ